MSAHTGRIRIVTADDHAGFRGALRKLLESQYGFQVVGEAPDGIEAIEAVRRESPDVLLLDVAMPRMGGLDTLRRLAHEILRVRTILLTAAVGGQEIATAFRLGARGVVLKASATELLHPAISAVMAGDMWIGRERVAGLSEAVARTKSSGATVAARVSSLTPREREVFAAVAHGASNREIAASLEVSEQTIKSHLSNILVKCGVSTRLELALLASSLPEVSGSAGGSERSESKVAGSADPTGRKDR